MCFKISISIEIRKFFSAEGVLGSNVCMFFSYLNFCIAERETQAFFGLVEFDIGLYQSLGCRLYLL